MWALPIITKIRQTHETSVPSTLDDVFQGFPIHKSKASSKPGKYDSLSHAVLAVPAKYPVVSWTAVDESIKDSSVPVPLPTCRATTYVASVGRNYRQCAAPGIDTSNIFSINVSQP